MPSSLSRTHRGGLALLMGLPLIMTLSSCDDPAPAPSPGSSEVSSESIPSQATLAPTEDDQSATPAASTSPASATSEGLAATDRPVPSLPPAPSVTASTWGQDHLAPRENAYLAPSEGAGPSGREDSDG